MWPAVGLSLTILKKCVCDQLKLILQFHVENRMSSITNLIIVMHMVSFLINIMEK